MDSSDILDVMKTYVKRFNPDINLDELENQPVSSVLITSFDAIEFAMHLEDELGLGDEALNIEELAPKFEKLNFSELADEISQFLKDADTGTQ